MIPLTDDLTFEYMIAGAWSEGAVYNTVESFKAYMLKTVRQYNNPVTVRFGDIEEK